MTAVVAVSELRNLGRPNGAGYAKALCPFHDDHRPSLSVNMSTGRARCLACGTSATVDGLTLVATREHTARQPARRTFETTPVDECLAAELMLHRRGITAEVAAELGIRAHVDAAGQTWLVFQYTDESGTLLYTKRRAADGSKDMMIREPRGARTVLYGLPLIAELRDDEPPIIAEGELDVAALWALGEHGVCSVPDGCGSKLTPELLAPLRRFHEITIGVDSDAAGDGLAERLEHALSPARCRRILWSRQ